MIQMAEVTDTSKDIWECTVCGAKQQEPLPEKCPTCQFYPNFKLFSQGVDRRSR
jgi:rubrerythrin